MTEWLSTAKVSAATGRHPVTIRRAAEEGVLHGHQTGRGGRWQFNTAAVDAWIKGQNGEIACGCARRGLKAA
jgi:excisionase family DNA binding protein